MNFLKKIREKPEGTRKLILWSIMVSITLALVVWWSNSSYWKIKNFKEADFLKGLKLSPIKEKIENLPEIDIPEPDEEEMRGIQEGVEKIKEEIENEEQNDK